MPDQTITVSDAVWNAIAERGKFGETEDDVLRRVFGLAPDHGPEQPPRRQHGTRRKLATKRMSARAEGTHLVVEFVNDGIREEWELPDKSDREAIQRVRDDAVAFARKHGATRPGQTNAVMKALTTEGYYLKK